MVGKRATVGRKVQARSQIKKLQLWDFGLFCCCFFSQTVILISENHKFIHLPFSLEVKCEGFENREQASTSVTCQRAAEQKHWYRVSYIFIYEKSFLPCDTTFRLQPQFNIQHISMNPLNLTNNSQNKKKKK